MRSPRASCSVPPHFLPDSSNRREPFRFQPLSRHRLGGSVAIGEPLVTEIELVNGILETTKRALANDRIAQPLARTLIALRGGEALHQTVLVELEFQVGHF